MGNQGRYGKYGESKRLDRLRRSKDSARAPNPSRVSRSELSSRTRPARSSEARSRVRSVTDADLNFIARLSGKAFARYGPYGEIIPQWFKSANTVTLVASRGAGPAGFAMLALPALKEHSPPFAELLAIAVERKHHRKGIGDLLLKEIEKKALENQVGKIFLHTSADNLPAHRLFGRNGYRACDVKKNFYPGGQNAVMMFKEIPGGRGLDSAPPSC